MRNFFLIFLGCFFMQPLFAEPKVFIKQGKKPQTEEETSFEIPLYSGMPKSFRAEGLPSLPFQSIVLASFVLLPFILMLLTPFAKFVMVFSLLRNALGVQQVPPNQVINGISLLLSVFVMFPVGLDMYKKGAVWAFNQKNNVAEKISPAQYLVSLSHAVKEPLRLFLERNTNKTHVRQFFRMAFKTVPEEFRNTIEPNNFIVLVPAYITTQVKSGFETGALIFLPFFVIDMVVSNILLAMGMMMLSPVTISLPIKIFLLVMVDGWTLLTRGLIDSYKIY